MFKAIGYLLLLGLSYVSLSYADEATEDGGVTVSARQQQNLGIKTALVEKKTLDYQFDAFATVSTTPLALAGIICTLRSSVETVAKASN